jgi:solute:Na+ symporter, SSS family
MSEYGIGVAALLAFYTILGIAMYVFVQKSGKRFIVAGKRLPFIVVGTMLYAQALDANSTVGSAAAVYTGGFWTGFVFPLGLALCLIVTGIWFAKPLNRMNLITLADFYFRRYSSKVEVPVALIMAVSFIILVAGNLAGCAWILKSIFNIDYVAALVLITVLVLAYTFSGGLFSSAATDVVQEYPAFLAFVAAPIILVATFGWDFFAAAIPPGYMDLSGLTSIENGALVNWAGILALALGDVVALDFMERVFAAQDPKTAQYGCYWGAFFSVAAGLGACALGLMALTLYPGLEDPRDVLTMIATKTEELPFIVGLFVLAGVVGAGLSTANGGALAVASVFGRNILHRNILLPYERRKAAALGKTVDDLHLDWHKLDQRLLLYARFLLIPVFLVAWWLAIVKPEPGVMLVLAFDVVFAGCLVPLVLGIFWSKANTPGALASVIIGSGLRLLLFLGIPVVEPGLDTLIPPVVSLVAMVAVSLATQERDHPKHHVITEIPTDEQLARGYA